jgi:hypothetical protein
LEDSTFIITQNNASLPADTRDLDGDSNITEAIPLNIARNPRVNGTNVDLGACELLSRSLRASYFKGDCLKTDLRPAFGLISPL